MATNILQLPQLRGSFAISRNADWLDTIYFTRAGQPEAALFGACRTIELFNIIYPLQPIDGLVSGMVVQGVEIPGGARVGYIADDQVQDGVTLVAPDGSVPAYAWASNNNARLTFLPAPLDLTGIAFHAEVRRAAGKHEVAIRAKTEDGTLINRGQAGSLSFNVPQSLIEQMAVGSYVFDIVAIADGRRVNLFAAAPATLAVGAGITDEP